ncbi:hypothetical protein F0562_019281 [Nyssa sinensis]|uniref:Uncharacterized protein n=1 Tax=Nyssa sinensis TaxID=561372 RepID=A0A5J4ZEN6_9ASTE|nr:hypothetical protein F0562_019281 [Nyssa sinensis]
MQIIGFSVRLSSSLLWILMYKLGVSYADNSAPREADFDLRNSFLNPATPDIVRRSSDPGDALGGSIYDPVYYSSFFKDSQGNGYSYGEFFSHRYQLRMPEALLPSLNTHNPLTWLLSELFFTFGSLTIHSAVKIQPLSSGSDIVGHRQDQFTSVGGLANPSIPSSPGKQKPRAFEKNRYTCNGDMAPVHGGSRKLLLRFLQTSMVIDRARPILGRYIWLLRTESSPELAPPELVSRACASRARQSLRIQSSRLQSSPELASPELAKTCASRARQSSYPELEHPELARVVLLMHCVDKEPLQDKIVKIFEELVFENRDILKQHNSSVSLIMSLQRVLDRRLYLLFFSNTYGAPVRSLFAFSRKNLSKETLSKMFIKPTENAQGLPSFKVIAAQQV